jgi:hypothetical protein
VTDSYTDQAIYIVHTLLASTARLLLDVEVYSNVPREDSDAILHQEHLLFASLQDIQQKTQYIIRRWRIKPVSACPHPSMESRQLQPTILPDITEVNCMHFHYIFINSK